MFCRHFVLLPVLALVLSAQAREPQADANVPTKSRVAEAPEVTRVAEAPMSDQQRRRDVLRQATRVQMEEAPGPTRQLSAQERAELRLQLQQQRLDLLK
jgi:hypothetical protein